MSRMPPVPRARPAETIESFVSVAIDGQLFGLPIHRVRDVFQMSGMTRTPLAPPTVAGIFNLRGRIITAVDMRRRLGMKPWPSETGLMAVGVEHLGDAYGLIVDRVRDVIRVGSHELQPMPANVPGEWGSVSRGVFRLPDELMVALDVDRVLGVVDAAKAA